MDDLDDTAGKDNIDKYDYICPKCGKKLIVFVELLDDHQLEFYCYCGRDFFKVEDKNDDPLYYKIAMLKELYPPLPDTHPDI